MKINIICLSLSIWILIAAQVTITASDKRIIDPGLLKYNRQKAIEHAINNWNTVASGYFNFGDIMLDPDTEDDPIQQKVLDYRHCGHYGVQIGFTPTGKPICGGDCANFVSQCLLEGAQIIT